METLPKDPILLLSVINMKLRDFYPDLNTLCIELMLDKESLTHTLAMIDYHYNPQNNQFI